MNDCPFNKENKCDKCSLFVANSFSSSANLNGSCAIMKIANELHVMNEQNKIHTNHQRN